jgi:hypothetical protein
VWGCRGGGRGLRCRQRGGEETINLGNVLLISKLSAGLTGQGAESTQIATGRQEAH